MRCPKCSAETPPKSLRCPECKLLTPRGRAEARAKEEQEENDREIKIASRRGRNSRRRKKGERIRVSASVTMLVSVLTVGICGVGMYVALTMLAASKPPVPGSAEYVIQTLSALPSKAEGMTVQQRLDAEVEKSRDEGHLLEREGWDVRPDGEMTFRIAYTFQEKRQKRRAEWIFDVGQNLFTPQTDLAEIIYGAKPQ